VCLIVDASAAAEFLAKPSAILKWLLGKAGNPRLVAAGKLRRELAKIAEVQHILVSLDRAGRLRSADEGDLRLQEGHFKADDRCRSNDTHVLALAVVSGARTLATFDRALSDDFKDQTIINHPGGKVYRDPAAHSHLLGHTPASCGVPHTSKPRKPRLR
jgi:predicted nucleic acid-binding protein